MLAYTSKQNSFHSRTHRVTTFGVPYGMNMPHVFLHVSNYGHFHATKKNRLEISEIPRAQWNVHSGWTDPTQATGTLDMVIVIVRRIQKSSTGDNNFVSSVRPIEITRPVKVDHFRSWSRILRSDQTKWSVPFDVPTEISGILGWWNALYSLHCTRAHIPTGHSRPSLEPKVRKLLHIETLCKGLFTWTWETPGRWGNPPVHATSFYFDHVYMIGGVTRRMLPHLYGVPHLHVNRP